MDRMPFGISRLDELIGGGAPTGSSVLLAGELGAGAREFCYTSAAMSALAHADDALFELYYGEFDHDVRLPSEIHYVSFTTEPSALVNEMRFALEDEILDAAREHISFFDLTSNYFEQSQVPMEWYTDGPPDINSLGNGRGRTNVLGLLGEYLSQHGTDSLIVIDSVTDLVTASGEHMSWEDISVLLKGLGSAVHRWDGLVLLLVNRQALSATELASVMDASHGSLMFEWESGGSERVRTMVVQEFRGVLSRLQDEDIIKFETDIYDHGFDITGVRKIR